MKNRKYDRKTIKEIPLLYLIFTLPNYFIVLIKKIPRAIENICYSVGHYKRIRLLFSNDFTVGVKTLAVNDTRLPHPVGMVIGESVSIGRNCTIYQNVTIGRKDLLNDKYPKIGNNVIIYAGACIIGDISVGDNVIIGASAFVSSDVPANSTVIGNPMRIL